MNAVRGETQIDIDGRPWRLCLTLGALAELETALACRSLAELSARLSVASAEDLALILAALMRGGGAPDDAAQFAASRVMPGDAGRAIAAAFKAGLGA